MPSYICPGCGLVEIISAAPGPARVCFTCADARQSTDPTLVGRIIAAAPAARAICSPHPAVSGRPGGGIGFLVRTQVWAELERQATSMPTPEKDVPR